MVWTDHTTFSFYSSVFAVAFLNVPSNCFVTITPSSPHQQKCLLQNIIQTAVFFFLLHCVSVYRHRNQTASAMTSQRNTTPTALHRAREQLHILSNSVSSTQKQD